MQSMWESIRVGALASGGFFVSTFLFGIMFGLAASAAGIEVWQGLLMSGSVFSASAQFAALEFWQSPMPLGAIALSVVLVSSRNILLGLSVAEQFDGYSLKRRMAHLFLLSDPAVVTLFSRPAEINRLGYLTGYGLALWGAWMISTSIGFGIADVVGVEFSAAFGFAGPLVMATMLMLFIKGPRTRHLPWITSGIAALILTELSVSSYAILPVGVLCGVVAGVIQHRKAG